MKPFTRIWGSLHTVRRCCRTVDKGFIRQKTTERRWEKVLQGNDGHVEEIVETTWKIDQTWRIPVYKLQEQLKFALAARRSHLKGDLLPHVVASEVCNLYSELDSKNDKAAFFKLISEELGVDFPDIKNHASLFTEVEGKEYGQLVKAKERLHQSLTPPYKYLLVDIGRLQGGVKFLVNMREDLLGLTRSKLLSSAYPTIRVFDKYLKEHLAQWFAAGFLELEQVTWDCGASFLEKVVDSENVHKMTNLEDLKQRLGQQRRCFIFTHRMLPGEPLVVLHTALWQGLPSCIQDVLKENTNQNSNKLVDTAAFYSISSTQPGLSGIDLGNFLIKTVVQKLQNELPDLQQFGTLSPIPGFRRWLDYQLAKIDGEDKLPTLLQGIGLPDTGNTNGQEQDYVSKWLSFKETLQANKDTWPSEELKDTLLQLCARYLILEKRRNFAYDAVANFHLRNGAIMWRLNWLGDRSSNGIQSSYGMMVNYKYDLSQIEKNNREYLLTGHIARSDDVEQLIKAGK